MLLFLVSCVLLSSLSSAAEFRLNTGELFASKVTSSNQTFEIQAFEWKNCEGVETHSQIHKIEVGPDPINLPGDVSVGFEADLDSDIVQGSPFSVRIKKKVAFFWINVPCRDGSGSCDYEDFCTKWPIPSPCPDAYVKNNISCQCPLKAGHYLLPFSNLGYLNAPGIPNWLKNGEYKLMAYVTNQATNKYFFCFELGLQIKAV